MNLCAQPSRHPAWHKVVKVLRIRGTVLTIGARAVAPGSRRKSEWGSARAPDAARNMRLRLPSSAIKSHRRKCINNSKKIYYTTTKGLIGASVCESCFDHVLFFVCCPHSFYLHHVWRCVCVSHSVAESVYENRCVCVFCCLTFSHNRVREQAAMCIIFDLICVV